MSNPGTLMSEHLNRLVPKVLPLPNYYSESKYSAESVLGKYLENG